MKKIDSILLHVEDLEASIKFYEDALGLHRGWTDEGNRMIGFVFPGNDTELVIHTDPGIPNPSVTAAYTRVRGIRPPPQDFLVGGDNNKE